MESERRWDFLRLTEMNGYLADCIIGICWSLLAFIHLESLFVSLLEF